MNRTNEITKLLDRKFNTKMNVIKFSAHETFEHFLAKCLLAYEIRQNGENFVSEAIFNNGKRADLVNLNVAEAWEITHSESDKSIEQKKQDYPIKVIKFDAKKVIEHWKKAKDI